MEPHDLLLVRVYFAAILSTKKPLGKVLLMKIHIRLSYATSVARDTQLVNLTF